MKLNVYRLCRPRRACLPSDRLVKSSVSVALRRARFGEVNVIFCSAKAIIALNRRYLKKNRITDVIAFNLGADSRQSRALGEIYVCVPQGQAQAAEYGNSPRLELLTLCVHGALHLAGMDDATASERRRMDKAAARIVSFVSSQRGR
ncbi:MAG TPA: rRNA maturation RNase YbeY [Elusimicrobiales bacterium]|nr:rRNA maturation RNase YbeY [Elusimicrobiales bacterium]